MYPVPNFAAADSSGDSRRERWLRGGNSMPGILARLFALAIAVTVAISPAAPKEMWVFFGTHVDQPGHGFSVARFDTRTGALTKPEFLQQSADPGFFVIARDGKHIYVANEVDTYQGQPTGFPGA